MESIIVKALAAKKTKEFILAHPEYKLNFWQHCREKYFLYLRRKGFSIAYIAGHKEFYGLDFLVNKHTLIPRPETELMVEEVLDEISKSKFPISNQFQNLKITLIDVGTGTGCIPISIGKQLTSHFHKNNKNAVKIFATDISRSALRIAKKNAKMHGVKIKFLYGNLLDPLKKYWTRIINSKIIITANLPYLTEKQFNSESSIQQEPKNALVADNIDGLSLYKKLLEQIKSYNFSNIFIYLEIDPSQSRTIKKIVDDIFPKAITEIKNDLAGRDRLVIIRIN